MSFRKNLTSNLCDKFLTVKSRDPSPLLGAIKEKVRQQKAPTDRTENGQ
jgi:hypothetical protein